MDGSGSGFLKSGSGTAKKPDIWNLDPKHWILWLPIRLPFCLGVYQLPVELEAIAIPTQEELKGKAGIQESHISAGEK